jgi:maleamate amidohydrolase
VQAYFDRACSLYAEVEETLASALRLRAAARSAGIPVVLTNVVYHPQALDGGRFFQKAAPLENFVRGHPMGAWPAGLAPFDDELVVSKQYASAFFGTSLASTLTSWERDSVILTGLTTSGCVRASCVDACSHGFIPIVVREAVGDRHAKPHEANLFDMDAKYADVVSEQETVAYLKTLQRT